MRLKRILSIFLILALSLTFSAYGYTDTAGHWGETLIEKWSGFGVIVGSDGKFRPNDPITRGEMAVILDRVMKYRDAAENTFRDLADTWYTDAVLKASAADVMRGADGYVRPNDKITREEAVVIIGRAISLTEDAAGALRFSDKDKISGWAAGYIGAMAAAGYVSGDGSAFNPKKNITRAEAVALLHNIIAEIHSAPGTYSGNYARCVVVNTDGVSLESSVIEGDLIVTPGATVLELTDVIVRGEIKNLGGAEIIAIDKEEDAPPVEVPPVNIPPVDLTGLDLSRTSDETVRVTIPPGYSAMQTFELLESKGICAAADLLRASRTRNYSKNFPLLERAYAAEGHFCPLEGYLFPDTYEFYKGSSPDLTLSKFLQNAHNKYVGVIPAAAARGLSLDDLVIISSIIEKEVSKCSDADIARVASIIYNRLELNMPLQMDVSRNYLSKYIAPYVSEEDLEKYALLYDSYKIKGLPAGAICSPAMRIIELALKPTDTNYLFFLSDKFGNLYFAVTYEEHVQNVGKAAAATGKITEEPTSPPSTPNPSGSYAGYKVMLDPGHGGSSPGSTAGAMLEKYYNVIMANRIKAHLENVGITVYMTRDGDATVSGTDRVEMANALGVDLYISLHANAMNSEGPNGIVTFYYPGTVLAPILAAYVQEALIAWTGATDLGIRSGELFVLHYTNMPSILCEVGFLTNPAEHAKLMTESYQEILAQAIVEGILKYIDSGRGFAER